MKKLLILPLLVILTGCVTYYYPDTALEDGVYYAEDDPSYAVYPDAYAGVAYYPWSSLDYFYLGYSPYPGYSFGYGYSSGFSFGISYGFSPWYYPHHHHGYYSPWYTPHYYSYYPVWKPYHGYYPHHPGGHHKDKKKHRGGGHDRYAGNDHNNRQNKYAGKQGRKNDGSGKNDGAKRRNRDVAGEGTPPPTRRYVSTTSGSRSGDRGMVIRSREATKITRSKLHAERPAPVSGVKTRTSRSTTNKSGYAAKRSTSDGRYGSYTKPGRSSTEPVKSVSSSRGTVVKPASPASTRVSSHGGRANSQTRTVTRQEAPRRPSASSRPPAKSQVKVSSSGKPRPSSSSSSSNRKVNSKPSSKQRKRR